LSNESVHDTEAAGVDTHLPGSEHHFEGDLSGTDAHAAPRFGAPLGRPVVPLHEQTDEELEESISRSWGLGSLSVDFDALLKRRVAVVALAGCQGTATETLACIEKLVAKAKELMKADATTAFNTGGSDKLAEMVRTTYAATVTQVKAMVARIDAHMPHYYAQTEEAKELRRETLDDVSKMRAAIRVAWHACATELQKY
jgi:hypothetical protein